jgi:hypothetical protein
VKVSPLSTSVVLSVPTVLLAATFSANVLLLRATSVGLSFTGVKFTVEVVTDEVVPSLDVIVRVRDEVLLVTPR